MSTALKSYQALIHEIDPNVYAPAVEAWMRLEYGTLDHLSRDVFVREVALFKEVGPVSPAEQAALARSYGL